jgi:lipopolysaccharide transport system permease protein
MTELSVNIQNRGADPERSSHEARPYKILRPKSGWQALNVRELWRFRDLFLMLALRDIRLRYKQTALGVAWVVLQPLMAAGIFSFVFGMVAKLPSDGVPYFVFSYAGLLGWNLFSNTLTKASTSLVGNAGLVSKVYFPRLVLPLSTILSSLLDFCVAFIIYIVLMAVYRLAPGPGLLLLPLWMAMLLLLSTGIGLYAASLMVSYRDIQYIVPVVLQFLLYASPIAYAVTSIPRFLQVVYMLNPISSLLEAFRWSLLNRGTIHPSMIACASAVSIGVFLFGAFSFRRMERQFADVI